MGEQVLYAGKNIRCLLQDDQIAELWLDHGSASVNKIDRSVLEELQGAINAISQEKNKIKGMIIASSKDVFVVGADITEFKGYFSSGSEVLARWLTETHKLFNKIEDFPFPTATAIGGTCLGGGMELALTTCFRVASEKATLGLPETKLGIYPGWGGTIRLPRLIGSDNALEWIAGGGTYSAIEALKTGVIDAVVAGQDLHSSCRAMIRDAADGKLDWQQRRKGKINPLRIVSPLEESMIFESARAYVRAKAGANYPAPLEAVKRVQQAASMNRETASSIEIEGFVRLSQTPVADNLITIFLSDQYNKKQARKLAREGREISGVAVLGAGIMGGGIAYQSASKKIPSLMKDISPEALEAGMNEAGKLLDRQVGRGKITTRNMAETLSRITPTLSYGDFSKTSLVIEAVVEREPIKKAVYRELEDVLPSEALIASNTSTISISKLAEGMKHPERFCGIHFFNPVHRMPLVEVIRGVKTSDETISTAVSYALRIGKTPIVVNDCAGFLVNRVLFPYFHGFQSLLEDGADFRDIDTTMEKFGWPMGPAYLLDVIGIDTCVHAGAVMAEAYPGRMTHGNKTAIRELVKAGRLGQKSGKGFYGYTLNKKGKPQKNYDKDIAPLLSQMSINQKSLSEEEIIDRMMIPMLNESARCLAEGVVRTPIEIDLGVLYGLGFPPFRGGILKYADDTGLKQLVNKAQSLSTLGPAFEAAPLLKQLATEGRTFYQHAQDKG